MAGTGRITNSTGSTGSSSSVAGKGSTGGRKPSITTATNKTASTGSDVLQQGDEAEQSHTPTLTKPGQDTTTTSNTTTTNTTNTNNNQVTATNAFSLSSIFPPGGYPSIPGLPNLLPPLQSLQSPLESSATRANPHNPLPLCVDPAALEAARFVHLVSSASALTLQVTVIYFLTSFLGSTLSISPSTFPCILKLTSLCLS